MTKTRTFINLEAEADLTNVIDYIEDNTSVAVIDSEAHYNDTWILVEGTETEIDKIWDYVDTL